MAAEFFEKKLADSGRLSIPVYKVRLKSEYRDGNTCRVVPAGTEGIALSDGKGGRLDVEIYAIKVTGQLWGEGWIMMPKDSLEILGVQ